MKRRVIIINTSNIEKEAIKKAGNRMEILGACVIPAGKKARGFSKPFKARSGRLRTFKFNPNSPEFLERMEKLREKSAKRDTPIL